MVPGGAAHSTARTPTLGTTHPANTRVISAALLWDSIRNPPLETVQGSITLKHEYTPQSEEASLSNINTQDCRDGSPHGGLRAFHQSQLARTQLTFRLYVLQIWTRNTPDSGVNETLGVHRVVC